MAEEENERYSDYTWSSELAKELSLSSPRISQIISKLGLKDKLILHDSKKLISPEVADLIRKDVEKSAQSRKQSDTGEKSVESKLTVKHLEITNEMLNKQIEDLKADKANLQSTINGLTQAAINNSNALESRDRRIEELESQNYKASSYDSPTDIKSREVDALRAENEALKAQSKKGFFGRLFS